MAYTFLNGRFLDPDRYLWSFNRSILSDDRTRALVWLRQWMLDRDAKHIAGFVFNEYGIEQGKEIFRFAAASTGTHARLLRAKPPYQGMTELDVIGKRFQGAEGSERVLITQIRRCDWHPGFTELEFDRDNDGRRPVQENREPGSRKEMERKRKPGSLNVHEPDPEVQISHNEPSGLLLPTEQALPELQRFPNFPNGTKLPQLETEFENLIEEKAARCKRWVAALSSLEGTSSKELTGHANFFGDDDRELLEEVNRPPVIEEVAREPPDSKMLLIGDGLINIANQGLAEVLFQELWLPVVEREGVRAFWLPKSIHETAWPWLYLDARKGTRRAGFVAEVAFQEKNERPIPRTRYVMDFERKGTQQSSIIILWNKEEEPLDASIIRHVIENFAIEKTTQVSQSLFPGMRIGYRHHIMSDEELGAGTEFLKRIFETVSKINEDGMSNVGESVTSSPAEISNEASVV